MPLAGHSQYAAVRSVEGALIGGTISDLTGGKFANGAISGAVQGAMEEPNTSDMRSASTSTGDQAGLVLCTGESGVNPAALAIAQADAPGLEALSKSHDWTEWDNNLWLPKPGAVDDAGNALTSQFDQAFSDGSHISSTASYAPRNDYIFVGDMHVHPPKGWQFYATAADHAANPKYIVGTSYTIHYGFSAEDVRGYDLHQTDGWVVTAQSGKILYYPHNNGRNCYYEFPEVPGH